MKKLDRTVNRQPSQRDYNELIDVVNKLIEERVAYVSPGLVMRKSQSGTVIGLQGTVSEVNGDPAEPRKVLAAVQATQDTDLWDISIDGALRPSGTAQGADVQIITDCQYSATTHKFTYRTRTLKFDTHGLLVYIGAEGSLVEVFEAVDCTT